MMMCVHIPFRCVDFGPLLRGIDNLRVVLEKMREDLILKRIHKTYV
jgi:hypothetical protein